MTKDILTNDEVDNIAQDTNVGVIPAIQRLLTSHRAQAVRIEEKDRHIDQMADKLASNTCGCSYDNADDVCLHHSPMLMRAKARIEELEKRQIPEGWICHP